MENNFGSSGALMDACNDNQDELSNPVPVKPASNRKNKPPKASSTNHIVDEPHAVLLVDDKEEIQFKNSQEFARAISCAAGNCVKVISIVGKTGDGKSHTFNHAFFEGREVFQTSITQNACTMGVWAAHVPEPGYLLLDTEGLLGNASNPNQQKRLLLKLFAISDVVIYRTMAERLHSDIYTFLADASDAFGKHFKTELERIVTKNGLNSSISELGPGVIIYHETKNTQPEPNPKHLVQGKNQCTMDDFLREQFQLCGRNVNSFSTLRYTGSRRSNTDQPIDYKSFLDMIKCILKDNLRRSTRKLEFVFKTLKDLNLSFNSDLPRQDALTFVEEYFTCATRCLCCSTRCSLGLEHSADGREHMAKTAACRYEPAIENKLYYCKSCTMEGQETLLMPKYLEANDSTFTGVLKYFWSGFLLECPRHGVVYRSRAQWSNNQVPERTPDVDWKVVHVWPGQESLIKGSHPVGQIVIDSISNMSTQLGKLAKPHARMLADYIADSVAPDYWTPNNLIRNCSVCNRVFAEDSDESLDEPSAPMASRGQSTHQSEEDDGFKHHCRACGKGVCSLCSTARMPVPEHGYEHENVRVCNTCYEKRSGSSASDRRQAESSEAVSLGDPSQSSMLGRRVMETFLATSDYIKPILQGSKDMVKTYARPDYWQPDIECTKCPCCENTFGTRRSIHHCRQCGKGVCNSCSMTRRPVLMRGLDQPSRVCDQCSGNKLRKESRPAATTGTPEHSQKRSK